MSAKYVEKKNCWILIEREKEKKKIEMSATAKRNMKPIYNTTPLFVTIIFDLNENRSFTEFFWLLLELIRKKI